MVRVRAASGHGQDRDVTLAPTWKSASSTGARCLIGDGSTSALVGLDGTLGWLCIPRFDSEPVLCGLLDRANGGHFFVGPENVVEARQSYEPDTAVLNTDLRTTTGLVRVTGRALALRPGADLTDDAPGGRPSLSAPRSFLMDPSNSKSTCIHAGKHGLKPRRAASKFTLRVERTSSCILRCNRPLSGLQTSHNLSVGERLELVL
jgi:alpha,alpha-trehalase